MHQPIAFQESDRSELCELAAQYPLATLIVPCAGELIINHVPLLWCDEELHGHIARANHLATVLQETGEKEANGNEINESHEQSGLAATAIFHGPNGYVSPADYPTKAISGKVVPTWNYAVVHLKGELHLRDDPDFVRQQIDQITAHQESRLHPEHPWTLEDAPDEYAAGLQRSIVGIALKIDTVTGKYKLSQNRNRADREGATEGVIGRGDTLLAEKMSRALAP